MSGPQFLHIQSYSLKANPAGQSVAQILGEAERSPEYSIHVDSPAPPKIIFGGTPDDVRKKHDEMLEARAVTVKLKNGKIAKRGIRKDRHTLLTAVVSFPIPRDQIAVGSSDHAVYLRWIELNKRWLQDQFGEQLISIIEHEDEAHPHLHAFVLPLSDPACMARRLNPAWAVKEEAERLAKESGHPAKTAVKLGNRAYKERGRELQEHYYHNVGLPAGLTRTGPKRERLSRAQWKARKDQARRDAKLHSDMAERVERIVDAEDGLEKSAAHKAEDLAEKLALVDQAYREADAAKRRATRRAQEMVDAAKVEALQLRQKVREELATQAGQMEASKDALDQEKRAFELEKRRVVKRVTLDVAGTTARVILGVFRGTVQFDQTCSSIVISDRHLAKSVDDYRIMPYLEKPVAVVLSVWLRLSAFLPKADVKQLQSDLKEELKPASQQSDWGHQP